MVDCATGATVSHDVRVRSCVYEERTKLYGSQTSCVHMYIIYSMYCTHVNISVNKLTTYVCTCMRY